MERAKRWINEKVVEPGKSYIQHGAEPRVLARSAAVGFVTGLCPLLGVSAGLTCLFVFVSRGALHGPMALLANLVSVPVELAMIVPYMYVGEWLTGAPHQKIGHVALKDLFKHAPSDVLKGVGRALLAWAITLPLLAGLLYLALNPAFQYLRRKYMVRPSSEGSLTDPTLTSFTPLLPVGGTSSLDGAAINLASRRSSSSGSPEW